MANLRLIVWYWSRQLVLIIINSMLIFRNNYIVNLIQELFNCVIIDFIVLPESTIFRYSFIELTFNLTNIRPSISYLGHKRSLLSGKKLIYSIRISNSIRNNRLPNLVKKLIAAAISWLWYIGKIMWIIINLL